MDISTLQTIYAAHSNTKALTSLLANPSVKTIYLEHLCASSAPLFLSGFVNNAQSPVLFMKYDEYVSMGKSVGETWNLRGSLTVGVDYFVLPAMYVGAQIDPLAYTYNMTTYKPQEGLGSLKADSHNFSMLAAPTVKVGFRF